MKFTLHLVEKTGIDKNFHFCIYFRFKIASQFDTAINDKYLRNDVLLKATAHAPRSIPNPLLSESSLEKLKSNNGLFQLSQQTKNLYLEKNSLIENSLAKKRLNVNLRISGTEGPIAKCARLTRSEDKLADTSSTVNDDVFPKYSFSRDSEKREHLFEWEIDDIEDRYRNDILKQTEVKVR